MSTLNSIGKALDCVRDAKREYEAMMKFCEWRKTVSNFSSADKKQAQEFKEFLHGFHAMFEDDIPYDKLFAMDLEYSAYGDDYKSQYAEAIKQLEKTEKELNDLYYRISELKGGNLK